MNSQFQSALSSRASAHAKYQIGSPTPIWLSADLHPTQPQVAGELFPALSHSPAPAPSPPGPAQGGLQWRTPLQLTHHRHCLPGHVYYYTEEEQYPFLNQLQPTCSAINVNHPEQPTPRLSPSSACRRTSEWSWGSEMWNSLPTPTPTGRHSPHSVVTYMSSPVSNLCDRQQHLGKGEGRALPNSVKETRGRQGAWLSGVYPV